MFYPKRMYGLDAIVSKACRDEVVEALRAVTAEDIRELAEQLFRDELLCGAIIGPGQGRADLEEVMRLP